MGHKTFIGGVHPYDGKELSKDSPIKEVLPKGDMVYPVSQHIGAPAKPVVAVGDTVLKGQMIAEAGGFVSSPIYSSVSGKVKAIEKRRVAVGDMVDSIVIENDGMFTETTYESVEDVTALSKEEIIEKVKNAGVVGMGGAGFPTHVKLSPKEPDKIEYIIANCAECEPYLTSDYRRMLENPEELIGGMKIILQLFDNAKGILGIEDNKPDCIEKLTELTKDEPRIEVCPLMTKYPQGGERQLIYATTGRAINSKMLPADAGCIVDNVETIIAVYNAVKNGQPVLKRISTVTGDAVKNPSNILYSIGTSYQELVDAAGGFKSQPEKIISGGPMMADLGDPNSLFVTLLIVLVTFLEQIPIKISFYRIASCRIEVFRSLHAFLCCIIINRVFVCSGTETFRHQTIDRAINHIIAISNCFLIGSWCLSTFTTFFQCYTLINIQLAKIMLSRTSNQTSHCSSSFRQIIQDRFQLVNSILISFQTTTALKIITWSCRNFRYKRNTSI